MINRSKWEQKRDVMNKIKIKLDDIIDLDAESTVYISVKRRLDALKKHLQDKITDLYDADKSRPLYSLQKLVQEVTIILDPFGGNAHENIFKFKAKFFDALEANQVREKGKVEVLRKHLYGFAKECISDDTDITSIKEAFKILEESYDNYRETWNAIMKEFKAKCEKPEI